MLVNVFSSNHHHSNLKPIGSFVNKELAINNILMWADKNIDEGNIGGYESKMSLLIDLKNNLTQLNQSQCMPDFEFIIKDIEVTNELSI